MSSETPQDPLKTPKELEIGSLPSDTDMASGASFKASVKSPMLKLWEHIDARLISGFTPAYYASVMGTGISANILYNFEFPAHWLRVCGVIFAVVSLTFFLVLLALWVVALARNRDLFFRIHCDTAMAPFVGCFVMGFTSLVMFLNAVAGEQWPTALWVLWWICTVLSFYAGFLTFFLSTIGKHRKSNNKLDASKISMTFLLPVVTLTVSSSCGELVTPHLHTTQQKITTMVVSFVMCAIAVVLAFIVVLVNFWRLFVHKIPNTAQVLTLFLPIGFLGQGAFAILLFGRNCVQLLMLNKDSVASSPYLSFLGIAGPLTAADASNVYIMMSTAIMTVCAVNALTLISFGYFFTFIALTSTFSKMLPFAKKPNPALVYTPAESRTHKRFYIGFLRFHRGFWSMTFPLGTMALANNQLYSIFNGFEAFRYIGAIYACILILITIICLCGVVYRAVVIAVDVFTSKPAISEV